MKGYKIVLKRRKDQLKRNDLKKYEYIIFGHFDGMKIDVVDSWEKLSPARDEAELKEIEWEFLDEFVIKGAYDLEDNFLKKINEKLFVVVSMLNLNDEIVKIDEDNILEIIKDQLKVPDNGYGCKVLPTISYQDIVIIFWGNDLNKIKEKVEELRCKQIGSSEKAMITDAYTIVGVNPKKVYKDNREILENKIDVSIRIILESGVNVQKFWEELKKEIKNLDLEHKMKHMFGNSDIMIFLSGEEGEIFSLFIEKGCFNPGSTFFKKYISQIRTSVHPLCDCNLSTQLQLKNVQENKELSKKEQAFEEFWRNVRKFFKKNDRDYFRLTRNLSDMYKIYLSLIQSEHNGELEKNLTKTFKIFMDNIKKNIKTFEEQKQAIDKEEDTKKQSEKKERQKELFKNICKAFEIFKEYVFSFLQDLRRSDRMFIEESSLTHPSVASATKLVLFYDEYINKLAKKLVEMELRDDDDKRGYHFMILSGGTNDISTIDLFSYMNPWDKDLDKLIFVLIPERQLFDVEKTLFSLSHECAHFCGERNRNEREEYFVKAVSQYICIDFENYGKRAYRKYAKEKMKVLLERQSPGVENVEEEFEKIIGEEHILNGMGVYQQVEERLRQRLDKEIDRKKKEERQKEGYEFFVELNELMKKSWENLSLDMDFREYIYSVFLEMFKKYFEMFRNKLNKENQNSFSQIDFEIIKCDHYLKEYKKKVEESEKKGEIEIWNELQANVGNCFLKLYKEDSFNDILKIISTSMKECYADIVAVQCRDVAVEEFIMHFVDDNLTLEKCFPVNSKNLFRTALDLKIIFGVGRELGKDTKERLRELFKKKNEPEIKCKFECEELIHHINCILDKFARFDDQDAIDLLKEYLKCIKGRQIEGIELKDISEKGNILQWKSILSQQR